MNKDSLGDRMKGYESAFTKDKLLPMIPAIVRIDGRAFHTFCRGLEKPFDQGLISLMKEVTIALVEESNAVVGYTQSDEISLILYNEDYKSDMYFGGKVFKIISSLASLASAVFNKRLEHYLPKKKNTIPTFDCRVWNVPNKSEVCNYLIWRGQDCSRNSIQSVGQSKFSHKELHGKNNSDVQDMLMDKYDYNWNDLEEGLKRGYFVRRNSENNIDSPSCKIFTYPILTKVENIEDVIFQNSPPVMKEEL